MIAAAANFKTHYVNVYATFAEEYREYKRAKERPWNALEALEESEVIPPLEG